MNISFRDIERRRSEIALDKPTNAPEGIYRLYQKQLDGRYLFTETRNIMRYWRELGPTADAAAARVLDLFEVAVDEEDSLDNIDYLCDFICENISNKVRDADEYQRGMNIKLGKRKSDARRLQTVVRSANRPGVYQNPTQDKITADERNRGYVAKPYGGLKKIDEQKEKKIEECYQKMYECSVKSEQCDRILNNNDRINRRFNFDREIRESTDIKDTIYQLLEYVNTYNASLEVRYNTALENISYSLYKNGVTVNNEELITMITGYFGMTESLTDEKFGVMYDVLKNQVLFTPSDTRRAMSLFEEEVTKSPDTIYEAMYILNEASKPIDPDKEFEKFKMKPDNQKDGNAFKALLRRVYANDSTSIADGIDNIFDIVRYGILVGSFAINPVLSILVFVTDSMLKHKYGIEGYQKAVKKYDREIMRCNRQIKKLEDGERKEAFKKYKDKLLECRSELDTRIENLMDEKQREEKSKKDKTYKLYDDGEDDFDFDFDFDFDEAATYIQAFQQLVETEYCADKDSITKMICEKIKTASGEEFEAIGEFTALCSDVVDKKKIVKSLEEASKYHLNKKEYTIVPNIDHAKYLINKTSFGGIDFKGIYEVYENTRYKQQAISDMIEFCTVNESGENKEVKALTAKSFEKDHEKRIADVKKGSLSVRNKLTLTLNNLRRDMEKLSDKERTLSKNVDQAVERIKTNYSRALTSYNREAVIKGSILPSASVCIKAAIATGAAWAVNPAIAVIGLIGAIGLAKSSQKKERQLIIDDIDIELAMCEKYLKLADEKGDTEATRNIMKTQRELQRQKNRLAYNMQMKFHEKQPTLPNVGEQNEAMSYINNFDPIEEKAKLDKDLMQKGVDKAKEVAHDAGNYVKNTAKKEISTGAATRKRLINKKMTKEEMLEHPELLKKYIAEEEDDPIITLGKLVDVISWASDVTESAVDWCMDKIKKIAKSTLDIADPRVKVAFKRTRYTCEKYINKLDREIAKETNPVKKRELKNQRKKLQDCLQEVDNKLRDEDMSSIKD